MAFSRRFLMLLACLTVCAVAGANSIALPPSSSTRLPTVLSVLGMIGVITVATRRSRREQRSPEPLTDAQRKRLKGAAICWRVSVGLVPAMVLALFLVPSVIPILFVLGLAAAFAGFVISVRQRGDALRAALPLMLYCTPLLLMFS